MENDDENPNQDDSLVLSGRFHGEEYQGIMDFRACYDEVNLYMLKRIPGFSYGDEE